MDTTFETFTAGVYAPSLADQGTYCRCIYTISSPPRYVL